MKIEKLSKYSISLDKDWERYYFNKEEVVDYTTDVWFEHITRTEKKIEKLSEELYHIRIAFNNFLKSNGR